ncbi:MAG: DUF2330 domain-containing protein [Candidatus Sericytochromatia bacterium]
MFNRKFNPKHFSAKPSLTLALAAGLLCAVPVLMPAPVLACGGFFCSRVPVDQAAERILFVKDGEEMVAHVQIQYTGPSEKFSWVVPVPSPPKLSVGSDALFQTLRTSTQPQFNLNLRTEGTCKQAAFDAPGGAASATPEATPTAAPSASVEVVSREEVGPYETVVLNGDNVAVLKDWLAANGYDVPAKVDPLLEPYIKNKMYLLALKLQKNRDAGDLQPIVMRYLSAKPMIPIQLTAVAATPDMDVQLWILGSHRAIPVNYPHVEVNEARIDWMNNGFNYRQVVTDAMNEAGGRGFVTDYAGDSSVLPIDQFDPQRYNLDYVRGLKDPVSFVRGVQNYFPTPAAWISFVSRHLPKPQKFEDISDTNFYGSIETFAVALEKAQVTANTQAAVTELDETLVKPTREIRRLFMENPYLTRLFTTLSPEEMTADPMFDFNPQLPRVALLRQAEGVRQCSANVYEWEAPIRITTPKGLVFTLRQNQPFGQGLTQGSDGKPLPAAARIQQLAPAGAATLLRDNTSAIQASLGSPVGTSPAQSTQPSARPTDAGIIRPSQQGTGCACNSPNTVQTAERQLKGATEGLAYASVLLGFAAWRRWRRKR